MRYRVLVPAESSDAIPRGAAVLEYRRGARGIYGRVFYGRGQYGELCAQAAERGGVVAFPAGCQEIGYYNAIDGELRAQQRGLDEYTEAISRRATTGQLGALTPADSSSRDALPRPRSSTPALACSPGHHDLRQLDASYRGGWAGLAELARALTENTLIYRDF
jgi:hypothetical protein